MISPSPGSGVATVSNLSADGSPYAWMQMAFISFGMVAGAATECALLGVLKEKYAFLTKTMPELRIVGLVEAHFGGSRELLLDATGINRNPCIIYEENRLIIEAGPWTCSLCNVIGDTRAQPRDKGRKSPVKNPAERIPQAQTPN
jgi:hypothetical protein